MYYHLTRNLGVVLYVFLSTGYSYYHSRTSFCHLWHLSQVNREVLSVRYMTSWHSVHSVRWLLPSVFHQLRRDLKGAVFSGQSATPVFQILSPCFMPNTTLIYSSSDTKLPLSSLRLAFFLRLFSPPPKIRVDLGTPFEGSSCSYVTDVQWRA